MDRMRELGGTKREMTSPVKETHSTPNQVEVINIEDDIAQDKKKRYKIEGSSVDQADCFAKVSVQSLHENTEMLLKLLEDWTKCVENLVELERIREANKVLVKEDRVKKLEIQKTDVERKRHAEKKLELQNKDGREKACSSRPALRPTTDEIEQAKAEARKKMIPCPRCFSLRIKFHSFSNYNLSKDKRICRDCKRLWVVGASLRN